jgi:nucleotide-binding universal stress UspA family protein
MIALKNVLVATDFSEPSAVALDYGRDLARSYDATLHVVHVIEDLLALHGPEIGFAYADVERNIEAAVRRDLDAALSAEDRQTLKARTVITRASNVSHSITDYAKSNAIDLIIVGTHGRGAIQRFLIGSVAERVMRTAPCPVLTVRTNERDFIDSPDDADVAEDYGQEARM